MHHEPTIDRDEVRRHVTVLVLTPSRLILAHTDEHAADDLLPEPYTSTSTEAVALSRGQVGGGEPDGRQPGVLRRQADPAGHEAVLTIGWGGVSRIDLEPAGCPDPECDADHGYTGVLASDDFSLRVSAAAEGTTVADLLGLRRRAVGRTQSR